MKQNKKTVIPVDKGIESAIHNFDKELFKYLVSYRRKVEKKQRVEADQNDVKGWLEKALEASHEEDSEFRRFYIGMLKNLDKAYNHIERESKCRSNNIKANELRQKLSFPNNVWNEADKGLGFILLPCETMVEAEKAMAIKLGAEIVDKTAEEIIQLVDEKAVEFERELSENQVRVLEEFMHNRRVPKKDVKLPFLKLNGKIQKLRQDEVEAKEIKKLTFRPVQDSISWSLNNYSYILMLFLREMNGEILSKYPEVMEIVTVSGHHFADEMKEMKVNKGEFVAMTTSDIENAYVNIDLKDLNGAIMDLCEELECEEWKVELMTKLATLVLSNNYMEASIGIMKNGTNLPMGNCVSGEALDTVAINSEMKKKVIKFPNEIQQLKSVLKLKRYRDDIYGMVSSQEVDDVVENIMQIGNMYPKHLKITMNLSHTYQSFLDCSHYRKLSDGKIVTFIRRNFNVPPLFVPKLSGVPEQIKWSAFKSELLRHRRICSEETFIEVNDKCLEQEYEKLGYKKTDIKRIKKNELSKYKSKYDENYRTRVEKEIPSSVLCGAKTVFDGFHKTHEVLKELIKTSNQSQLKLPITVPGGKLKGYLFTKRSYLRKQKEFIRRKSRTDK